MRAAVVTGACAPLGEGIALRLAADGLADRVLAVDQDAGPTAALRREPRILYAQARFSRQRDVRDLAFGPMRDLGAEVLIHTALHRRAREVGPWVRRQNVDSTRLLLELCERLPSMRHFVYRSHAEVYRVAADEPDVVRETHPLAIGGHAPQWIRDRVEADLMVCARMGLSRLRIAVLRCAEILAPLVGSQLDDYLRSCVAFTPLGYDPMLNLLSLEDAVEAHLCAVRRDALGVFNVAGLDTLPLSVAIRRAGRLPIPVPGALIGPLYRARRAVLGLDFRYDLNAERFHFSGVLDGRRARELLGYAPRHAIRWAAVSARPRWARLAACARRLR